MIKRVVMEEEVEVGNSFPSCHSFLSFHAFSSFPFKNLVQGVCPIEGRKNEVECLSAQSHFHIRGGT